MAKSAAASQRIQTVAILGGGPAAGTLATVLARAGLKVVIFHVAKRAPVVVGESLVPAIIPMLQLLGVEEEVRSFSIYKPGATVNMSEQVNFCFPFDKLRTSLPHYAYNVPRDRFDDALLNAARKAGAKVVEMAARVERVEGTDKVRLSAETLATANVLSGQPDLIVDATGRARLIPDALNIPSRTGPRKDTALFAHLDHAHLDNAGHVHTTRLDHGWSWRVPLPGRVSLGIVIGSEFLPEFGATKEERYDNLLQKDSVLRKVASGSKRLTPVIEHTNYQLVSERIVGDGWALVGDTAGFIDPVFSSGLFIGMQSAVELAEVIAQGTQEAFRRYEQDVIRHLESWHEIVEYFYNGRLFTFLHVGEMLKNNPLIKLSHPHLSKHLGRIFSGAASDSPYSLRLLRFAMKYGMKDQDPHELMIR